MDPPTLFPTRDKVVYHNDGTVKQQQGTVVFIVTTIIVCISIYAPASHFHSDLSAFVRGRGRPRHRFCVHVLGPHVASHAWKQSCIWECMDQAGEAMLHDVVHAILITFEI